MFAQFHVSIFQYLRYPILMDEINLESEIEAPVGTCGKLQIKHTPCNCEYCK